MQDWHGHRRRKTQQQQANHNFTLLTIKCADTTPTGHSQPLHVRTYSTLSAHELFNWLSLQNEPLQPNRYYQVANGPVELPARRPCQPQAECVAGPINLPVDLETNQRKWLPLTEMKSTCLLESYKEIASVSSWVMVLAQCGRTRAQLETW